LDYVFYGTHRLDERCRQFFQEMETYFTKSIIFWDLTQEQLISARDGIEQYILHRIGEYAYDLSEQSEEDIKLLQQMEILSQFLTIQHLDIVFNCEENAEEGKLLIDAGKELREINQFRTPFDKVECVVSLNCSSLKQNMKNNLLII
jgi:hypothetical protein